jgi:phage-related protein
MIQSVLPRLEAVFFRTESGREPVREWLRSLDRAAMRTLGEDISTVQFGRPVGMPLVLSRGEDLWELQSPLSHGTARVLFICEQDTMVLLHGIAKRTRRTPRKDLELARWRAVEVRQGGLF